MSDLRKKLLTTIKRHYPTLKAQQETSELFVGVLSRVWGGDPEDDTFRSLVAKVCTWISLQKPKLLQRQDREKAARQLEDYANSLLPSRRPTTQSSLSQNSAAINVWSARALGSSPSQLPGEVKFTNSFSTCTSSQCFYPELKQTSKEMEGSKVHKGFSGRVEGIIKGFREKNIIVALCDGCSTDEEVEVVIPRKALFSGGVRLNTGDTLTFRRSEKDPNMGYAPELVRIQRMDPDQIEQYIRKVKCLVQDNPREALTLIARCLPPLQYICSQGQLSVWITADMLDIIGQLIAPSNCLDSDARLTRILTSLANSNFTATILRKYAKDQIHSYFSSEASTVQAVVEALIKTVPERCTRLMPVIQHLSRLAHDEAKQHQRTNSSYADDKQKTSLMEDDDYDSWKSVEFILRITRSLSVSVSGAAEDVASLNWNELPLIPVKSELLSWNLVQDLHVPKVLTDQPYESEDAYLDTYFRLLREDCFHELKAGIQKFVRGKLDHRDMAVYRIHLDGIQIDNRGLALSVRFKLLTRQNIDWSFSRLLMFGNLVCLSVNGSFQEPIWAMVTHRTPELLDRGIVFLTLSSENNSLSDAEIILLLQSCACVSASPHKATRIAIMAESQTYYRAYGPVLRSLKEKSGSVPFKDELVDVTHTHKTPEYLEGCQINWSCIFDRWTAKSSDITTESFSSAKQEGSSAPVEFEGMVRQKLQTTLDETQLSAIKSALENRVTLIQGPPGTGKSFIGVKLAQLILSAKESLDGPILVLTYKNHALDQFLEDCLEFCDNIVRVGGRSQSEALKKYNLHELKYGARADRDTIGTKRQLADLREQFPSALRDLKNAHVFCVYRFIKAATLEQVQSLCKDWPQGTVDSSTVSSVKETEKLIQSALASGIDSERYRIIDHLFQSPEAQAAISCLLCEWTPHASIFLSVGQREKIPVQLLNDLSSQKKKPLLHNNEADMADEDDAEDLVEQRLLTPDITIAADRWRNPKEGFVQMDDVRSSEMPFAYVLPHVVVGDQDDTEVIGAGNLWHLSLEERAKLILCWMRRHTEEAQQHAVELLTSYKQLFEQLDEQRAEDDAKLISEASIVGMTTTGAAINAALINAISPKIILVEEAAEILESQLVAVLPSSAQHLIMIGDHKQLRPQVQCYDLQCYHNMDVSMFERLIKHLPSVQLGYQCRMREEFVELIRPIYPDLKTHKDLVQGNQACQCIEKSMFFWTHSFPEQPSQYSRSWCNSQELNYLFIVFNWLLDNGCEPAKITILTSYRGQLQEIRAHLRRMTITDVITSTIDRYQGDENDILLVSLVRSKRLGFLAASNRMCVAASRARCGVYFFGNSELLKTTPNSCWKPLIEHMESISCVGSENPLICPVHFTKPLITANGGGAKCVNVCFQDMPCGHTCRDPCHFFRPHSKCKETVMFVFPKCGHASSRPCHKPEENFYCKENVEHEHPICGHTIVHPCWQNIENIKCQFSCQKKRPQCGHPCSLLCHEECISAKACPVCDEVNRTKKQQQEEDRLKSAELQKRDLVERLEEVRKHPPKAPCRTPVIQNRDTKETFLTIQDQVSRFLPAEKRLKISVSSLEQIQNSKLLEEWLEVQKKLHVVTDPTFQFVLVHEKEIQYITAKGLAGLKRNYFYSVHPKSLSSIASCKGIYRLVRFKVCRGKCQETEEGMNHVKMKKKQLDSVIFHDKENCGLERLILLSAKQAIPDYVVTFAVEFSSDPQISSDLRMTYKEGYFELKSITPSRNVVTEESKLDDTLFRFAESQFHRMFSGAGLRFRVTKVDVVDNGDLNIRYRETKRRFEAEGKPLDELLVFHGTTDVAVDHIIREGFKIGGKDTEMRSGACYGYGVYTVENPQVAMRYSEACNRVLLSLILPGQRGVDYNSGRTDDVYVLQRSEQLLPRYVVHYGTGSPT